MIDGTDSRKLRIWLCSGLAAVALLAGACANDNDSQDSSGTRGGADTPATSADEPGGSVRNDAFPDPCSLLTTTDVDEATGLEFGEGTFNERLSTPDRQVCDWISPSPFASAQVMVAPAALFEDDAPAVLGPPVPVSVPGADDAVAIGDGLVVASLVGDLFVQVGFVPPTGQKPGDVTASLAATAVANL